MSPIDVNQGSAPYDEFLKLMEVVKSLESKVKNLEREIKAVDESILLTCKVRRIKY